MLLKKLPFLTLEMTFCMAMPGHVEKRVIQSLKKFRPGVLQKNARPISCCHKHSPPQRIADSDMSESQDRHVCLVEDKLLALHI